MTRKSQTFAVFVVVMRGTRLDEELYTEAKKDNKLI
jgi:hypothetical protein